MHTASQIKYDVEKMKWVNHKWIAQTPITELVQLCKPFLAQQFDISKTSDTILTTLIQSVQTDIVILQDICKLLEFYFIKPTLTKEQIDAHMSDPTISNKIQEILNSYKNETDVQEFFNKTKKDIFTAGIALKDFFAYVRLMITGSPKGLGIAELEKCLGFEEIKRRICR